ncbi:hypothetical protein [Paenibacillus sp. FSL R7-0026]|uniref:hypothetical protein n=1 Tax=Paenibacillus sp. FSL R7-0026 TaxID=2921668 RepID=UPI0030F973CC
MSEKRKRITFWESESEVIREWCKAQTNLGTSFDLIIADAIKAYGKGDVIKAHLNQRMLDMQSEGQSQYQPSQHVSPRSEATSTSSATVPSEPRTQQPPHDSTPTGNRFREETTSGSRDQGDSSDLGGIGDMIRREATSGSRDQGDSSDTGGIGDMIRREATSGSRDQGDSSDVGGIGDMIRREATGSSSQPQTKESYNPNREEQESSSSDNNLNIFLGDSDSRLI